MSAENGSLRGKRAYITGGNQGIGAATARRFAAAGAAIALFDLREDGMAALCDELRGAGATVAAFPADVTDPAAVEAAFASATQALGGPDILMNAAGIFHAAPLTEYPLEIFRKVLDVNVTGTLICTQAALRHMVPAGGGRIINLASIAGRLGGPFVAAYSASKHAVIGLTRVSANEMAKHGVTVNAICPGYVNTEMYDGVVKMYGELLGEPDIEALRTRRLKGVPLGRMVEAEEIAGLALYLAGPDAHGMTGQALTLDGGIVMQ